MKHIRVFVALAVGLLGYFGWNALHPRKTAASNDPSGTYLITITDPTTDQVESYSVITLHADHSVAVIDSREEDADTQPFSSQHGVWERDSRGVIEARVINWRFPYASYGSARVDFTFNRGVPSNRVQGSGVLTFFAPGANPLVGNGTPGGTFHFTGTRVTAP